MITFDPPVARSSIVSAEVVSVVIIYKITKAYATIETDLPVGILAADLSDAALNNTEKHVKKHIKGMD